MASYKIPSIVRSFLVEGEVIERHFDLKGCRLYATDRRLLEIRGRTTKDFDYAHISSIEYSSRRYWWAIIIGILIIIGGIFLLGEYGADEALVIGAASSMIGLILIIIGAIAKSERVEVTVVGLP